MELRRRMVFAGSAVFAAAMLTGRAAWAAVDPCSLLSTAEAASALGVPEVKAGGGGGHCTWTPKNYQKGAGQLTVQIEGAHDGAKMMNMGTPVSGVGDEAIWTVVPSTNSGVLHVRKGNSWFTVDDHGVPLDQAQNVTKTVGALVAGRL